MLPIAETRGRRARRETHARARRAAAAASATRRAPTTPSAVTPARVAERVNPATVVILQVSTPAGCGLRGCRRFARLRRQRTGATRGPSQRFDVVDQGECRRHDHEREARRGDEAADHRHRHRRAERGVAVQTRATTGIMPAIMATVVMTMGRARLWPGLRGARSCGPCPRASPRWRSRPAGSSSSRRCPSASGTR